MRAKSCLAVINGDTDSSLRPRADVGGGRPQLAGAAAAGSRGQPRRSATSSRYPVATPRPFSEADRDGCGGRGVPVGSPQATSRSFWPPSQAIVTIKESFTDAEKWCCEQTRQLYQDEGKIDLLAQFPAGIPDSLQHWLEEARQKVLGSAGYREKAWERLWGQVGRLERLLGRNLEEVDRMGDIVNVEAAGLNSIAACLRLLTDSHLAQLGGQKDHDSTRFKQSVEMWGLCKQKHDRSLRPRLSSADAVDELNHLDVTEGQRCDEMTTAVIFYRKMTLRKLFGNAKMFLEDLQVATSSFMCLLDTTLHRELMQVPPGTDAAKKRLTLKRLRKLHRVRTDPKSPTDGSLSLSGTVGEKERMWHGMDVSRLIDLAVGAQQMILSDFNSRVAVMDGATAPSSSVVAAEQRRPSLSMSNGDDQLLSDEWMKALQSNSKLKSSGVSTSHRVLIRERDEALNKFTNRLTLEVQLVNEYCSTLLSDEESWRQRWVRQVMMLRKGNL